MTDWKEEVLKRVADKTCADCAKFAQPLWVSDNTLGICGEGQFGQCEASDKNEGACEYFKKKER